MPAPAARTHRAPSSAGVLVLIGCLGTVAVAAAVLGGRSASAPESTAGHLGVSLVLLGTASALTLEFRDGGAGNRLDLFEAALAVALLALPGPLLLAAVAAAKLAGLALQRVPPVKLAFNVAQWSCAAALGGLVLARLRGAGDVGSSDTGPVELLALVGALCVVVAANAAAMLAVSALSGGRAPTVPRGPVDPAGAATLGTGIAVDVLLSVSLGLLFAGFWSWRPQAWPVLPVTLVVLHLVVRRWTQRRAGTARLVGLHGASAVLAGAQELEPVVEPFLGELRKAFDAAGAVLHLPGDGTWWAGPPAGGAQPLLDELVRRGAAVRLPGADPALHQLLASAGWRDALAAPVGTSGVLVTHDRVGWQGFEAHELDVLSAAAALVGDAVQRGRLTDELRTSEARWRTMVQRASDLVLVLDRAGRVSYASPACRTVLGQPEQVLLGGPLLDRVDPADRAEVSRVLAGLREGGQGAQGRLEFRTAEGERRVEAVASNRLADGAVDGIVLNARDVTARRRAESANADQARVLELVARGAPLSKTMHVLARSVELHVPEAHCLVLVGPRDNAALLGAAGLPAAAQAAVRDLARAVLSADPAEEALLDLAARPVAAAALLAHGVQCLQVRPLQAAGPDVWGALVLSHRERSPRPDRGLIEAATRVAALAVHHSLVQRRLAHSAAHDPLTDLPNRVVFLDRLGRALASSGRGSTSVLVLFLDLDRFKTVNDSLGHRAGDTLLQAVASRLRQAVRPGDTVARFGGDEFTMLCEGIVDEAHALRVVERVQSALARPFPLADTEIFATTSIGIAMSRGADRPAEVLVEDADAAMYRAKERGGNRFELFDGEMRDRALRRLDTQSALHRGLERGEFRVVYQPTVDLSDGRVVGAEALVRWDRSSRGVVLPDEFIPLAEETGLILPIGARVLDQALGQAARWQAEARTAGVAPPLISVNLSARQLTDPALPALVRLGLTRTGVDPAGIAFEITETALIADLVSSVATLEDLKSLGVRLYVDDFGTGYSSLTYLQRLPVDGVKVDRSFVNGLGSREDASAIVRAVIGLSHSLGLVVVAEGVETVEQVEHLRALDCEVAQGWYFGRPVPPDELSLAVRGVPAS